MIYNQFGGAYEIEKRVICLISLLSLILVGCKVITMKPITELEEILENFNLYSSIDLSYTTTIETEENTVSVDHQLIIKSNGDETSYYFSADEGSRFVRMYYIDGLLYSEGRNLNTAYEIFETTDFDINEENPLLTDLNFNELDYKYQNKEADGKIIYTISTSDKDLKPYIENILGEPIGNIDIDMTLKYVIDQPSKTLEAMKVNITLKDNEEVVNVEVLMTINEVGDEVDFRIPNYVTKRINDYRAEKEQPEPDPDSEPELDPEPDPNPFPAHYDDTPDGVVSYHKLGDFRSIVYDEFTDQIVVLRDRNIDIYDAETLQLIRTIESSSLTPYQIDADNGKLVVSYKSQYFRVYDLTTESEPDTIFSNGYRVHEIVIDDDVVIYSDGNYWSNIVFYDLHTNEIITTKQSISEPKLTINRKDHILYVTETNISSSDLIYYHSQTGEFIYRIDTFGYVQDIVKFDGMYIHHEGETFNRFYGTVVSSNLLNRLYNPYESFTPERTLFDSEKIAFVASEPEQYLVGIYDNIQESFIYKFSLYPESIIKLKNGEYLAVSKDQKHVAKIDIRQINVDLVDDEPEEQRKNTVVTSPDEKITTLRTSLYTQSVVDDMYIYTLNEYSRTLTVYSIKSLKKVYTERFLQKPVTLDAHAGKLVVGFGDAKQFRIYDTTTWDYEVVKTQDPVYSVVIYKNSIIYSHNDKLCVIRIYDLTTKTHSSFGLVLYSVTMAINRQDGIIYFGERNVSQESLLYVRLEDGEIIESKKFSGISTKVRLDEQFVYFKNKTFDKITGEEISNSELARTYQNNTLEMAKTIFDNDTISIYTGITDTDRFTIVFDLQSQTDFYTLNGSSTHAYVVGDKIILFNNSSEYIITLNLVE